MLLVIIRGVAFLTAISQYHSHIYASRAKLLTFEPRDGLLWHIEARASMILRSTRDFFAIALLPLSATTMPLALLNSPHNVY